MINAERLALVDPGQLTKCWPNVCELYVQPPALQTLGLVVCANNPSKWTEEVVGSEVQGHSSAAFFRCQPGIRKTLFSEEMRDFVRLQFEEQEHLTSASHCPCPIWQLPDSSQRASVSEHLACVVPAHSDSKSTAEGTGESSSLTSYIYATCLG